MRSGVNEKMLLFLNNNKESLRFVKSEADTCSICSEHTNIINHSANCLCIIYIFPRIKFFQTSTFYTILPKNITGRPKQFGVRLESAYERLETLMINSGTDTTLIVPPSLCAFQTKRYFFRHFVYIFIFLLFLEMTDMRL